MGQLGIVQDVISEVIPQAQKRFQILLILRRPKRNNLLNLLLGERNTCSVNRVTYKFDCTQTKLALLWVQRYAFRF